MDRVYRRLGVRQKWKDEGKLSVSRIGKVWKAEFKYLISNLTRSIEELNLIIGALDKLKKSCEKTKGEIKLKVEIIRGKMQEKITAKTADIEEQVKNFNDVGDCNWWHNFWGDCSQAQNARDRARAEELRK